MVGAHGHLAWVSHILTLGFRHPLQSCVSLPSVFPVWPLPFLQMPPCHTVTHYVQAAPLPSVLIKVAELQGCQNHFSPQHIGLHPGTGFELTAFL